MEVIKRDGSRELLDIQNIRKQTKDACENLDGTSYEELELDAQIAFKDGIKTSDIQQVLIETARNKVAIEAPNWTYVAQRLSLYDLYHNVKRFYKQNSSDNVYKNITLDLYIKSNIEIFSDWYTKYDIEEIKKLNLLIQPERDLLYDYAGFELMKKMYLAKNKGEIVELPQHLHMTIAMFAMQNEDKDKRLEYIKDYYNVISKLEFINATPINANARLNMGGYISCIITTVADSTDSIMDVANELAMASRNGAGVGIDISRIRSVGSAIGHNVSVAGGKIPFLKIYNDIALAFNQNGKRPGAFAMFIESWDLEIFDFIDLRKTSGDERRRAHNIQLAISYSDLFMKRVENDEDWTLFDPHNVPELTETWGGEFNNYYTKYENEFKNNPSRFNKNTKVVKAKDILKYHLNSWCDVGVPYVMFKDTMNRANKYPEIGLIRSSNLCVTGETRILTKKYGNVPIGLLVENNVLKTECWNGLEWSETELFKTSNGQECLTVTLDNGIEINATPYHDWYIIENYTKISKIKTKDLKPGMKLIKTNPSIIEETDDKLDLPYAYENGLFSADGCLYYDQNRQKNYAILHLYNEKINLKRYIKNYLSKTNIHECNTNSIRQTLTLDINTIYGKDFVPGPQFKRKDRLKWLAGLLDGDGTLLNNQDAQSIQLSSVDHEFLKNVYFMLQEFGISSTIKISQEAGYRSLPTNNKNKDYGMYYCKTLYRLMISGHGCNKLLKLGYNGHRIKPIYHKYNREANWYNKIVKIENKMIYSPTYCGNEPKQHMLTFNGQLTGNCTEISVVTNDELTGVCNLGSINLARTNTNEDIRRVSKIALRALDNLIDLTPYPSAKAKKFQELFRSTGVGSLGESEYIANKQIYYGSEEHKSEIDRIWKCISESLYETSRELAKEKGTCGASKEYRNGYLMAIAPNSSSAILAGTTNGLEPVYHKIWVEVSQKGQYIITAPHISLENYEYYQNAFEIDMIKQLEINAIRQKYIDMAQSQNVFVKPENNKISAKRLYEIVHKAWKLGVKTLYYLRTKPPKDIGCFNCAN